jgi:hypothetical protein
MLELLQRGVALFCSVLVSLLLIPSWSLSHSNIANTRSSAAAAAAGAMVVTDFLTNMVPALTADLKSTGPVEIQKKPAAAQ